MPTDILAIFFALFLRTDPCTPVAIDPAMISEPEAWDDGVTSYVYGDALLVVGDGYSFGMRKEWGTDGVQRWVKRTAPLLSRIQQNVESNGVGYYAYLSDVPETCGLRSFSQFLSDQRP